MSLLGKNDNISGVKAASGVGALPGRDKPLSGGGEKALPGKAAALAGPAAPLSSPVVYASPHRAGPDFGLSDALRELVSRLNLPRGGLSGDLISFFRFFSLPLDSKTLQAVWREVQNVFGKPEAPRPAGAAGRKREAAALGAAAAADKGLFLKDRALREYAAALDMTDTADFDGEAEGEGGAAGGGFQGGGFEGDGAADANRKGGDKAGASHKPDPAEIRQKIRTALEKRPVLDFINRIPGKNGRWIVFPFSFSGKIVELRSSFRLFLPERPEKTAALAADIAVFEKNAGRQKQAEQNGIPGRRWFFLLNGIPAGNGYFSPCSLEFSFESAGGIAGVKTLSGREKRLFSRNLAECLGLKPENVRFRDKLPPFSDVKADPLRSFNERV